MFYSLIQPADGDAGIKKAKQTMTRIARKLLEDSRAALMAEKSSCLAKDFSKGRDILSLLVRANMATDLPSSQRICDDDVLARNYSSFCPHRKTC